MIYRLWCQLTSSDVKSWQLQTLDAWDGVVHGKRVFDQVVVRQWRSEIAIVLGRSCAAGLWDFDGFFDSIPTGVFSSKFVASSYPLRQALLSLQSHLAPHILTASGAIGPVVCPSSSILAGCFSSVLFVKVFLREGPSEVAGATHAVQGVYVNDVSHFREGVALEEADAIVDGGAAIVNVSRKGGLRFLRILRLWLLPVP